MAERRKHERLSRRIRVRYWRHGQPDEIYTAFTKDLSLGGMYVNTNKPMTKGSRIQLEFLTPAGGFIAQGVVARTITYPRDMHQVKTGGMGIRFVSLRAFLNDLLYRAQDADDPLPAEYPHFAEEPASAASTPGGAPSQKPEQPAAAAKTNAAAAANAAPSAEPPGSASRAYVTMAEPWSRKKKNEQEIGTRVVPQYPVVFDTREAFLASYARDLRFGGLFVPTTSPAPIDSKIELALHVPSATVVWLEATVVHVAGAPNHGMGVQFSDPRILERLARAAQDCRETSPTSVAGV